MENEEMKITHADLEMLEKYEKILYIQNKKILTQLTKRGSHSLKFVDKKEIK